MTTPLILAALLLQAPIAHTPATPAPTAAPAPAAAPTLSEVTTLRAEVYLLRMRDLQRQAADLERMRLEIEAAVQKETGHRIDWATGSLVPATEKAKEPTP